MSIVDSSNEPYIDGLLVLSDDPPYVPAIELSYINTMLSLLSDHQLPTNSCNNHLPEAFDIPLIPCLDQSSPAKPSTNNHSRNRCASVDLAAELCQRDHSWHHINDEISANQLQQEEQAQLNIINGDILHDHVLIDADYAPNTAAISANYAFSDLEDVSDFLFMESQTASTQSVSHLGNSISLSGVDWKSDLADDSINQVESDGGDPSSGFHNMEVEKKNGGEVRASWRQKQVGEIRASWQQKQGDEIRASWQQKQVGEIRASWQPPPPSEGREGAPSSQLQDVGPRGPISAVWAGPTLMDIESALAKSGSHTHNNTSIAISSDPSAASSTVLVEYTLLQEEMTALVDVRKLLIDDLPTCKNELVEQDILSASWRSKLQKRNHVELKHSIKVRREENAVGDGYRWRKYGQKSIKNSPFPRSYYKCSSGKCNAKKQVEGCHEDATLLLVTYVGIHLHHRPKPLRKIAC